MSSTYGITRHFQRYEYILERGFVRGKTVLEVGCGYGAGASMLASHATEVIGVDPRLKEFIDAGNTFIPSYVLASCPIGKRSFVGVPWENIDYTKTNADVVVAIEVIEHLRNPEEFLEKMSCVCTNLFLTTPLAEKTAPTDNPEHVVEYAHTDLCTMLEKYFTILDTHYQTGDLRIVDNAIPQGSSLNANHIVQMLWCKTKGGTK